MNDDITQYLADKFGLPYITAQFLLSDWDVTEYKHFSIISKADEIHVLLKGKFMPRDGFRDVFDPIIKQYGKVTTRCQSGNVENIYFVERIGFKRVGFKNGFIQYEIDHIPFQTRRPPPCQSSFQ